jgi:hypothetical protein
LSLYTKLSPGFGRGFCFDLTQALSHWLADWP